MAGETLSVRSACVNKITVSRYRRSFGGFPRHSLPSFVRVKQRSLHPCIRYAMAGKRGPAAEDNFDVVSFFQHLVLQSIGRSRRMPENRMCFVDHPPPWEAGTAHHAWSIWRDSQPILSPRPVSHGRQCERLRWLCGMLVLKDLSRCSSLRQKPCRQATNLEVAVDIPEHVNWRLQQHRSRLRLKDRGHPLTHLGSPASKFAQEPQ